MDESKPAQFSTLKKPTHLIGDIWLVPCMVNKQRNSYLPMNKPLDQVINSDEFTRKINWIKEEDEALVELISTTKPKAWNLIARLLNNKIHKSIPVRKGRQCRERWLNFLDPSLKKDMWSVEEDKLLLSLHKELGNKWSEISKRLNGRNERSVKTRLNLIKKYDHLASLELNEMLEQSFTSGEDLNRLPFDQKEFEENFSKDCGFQDLGEYEGLDMIV